MFLGMFIPGDVSVQDVTVVVTDVRRARRTHGSSSKLPSLLASIMLYWILLNRNVSVRNTKEDCP